MDKYSVDFTDLNKKFSAKKVHKLSDVQHLLVKVAFDVVRFRENEDTAQLWRIEESVDGPVIVAMYDQADSPAMLVQASAESDWQVIADGETGANIVYKGEAIKRVTAASVGIDDVHLLCRWLPAKLSSDESFRNSLIKDMSLESRKLLLSKYPELRG